MARKTNGSQYTVDDAVNFIRQTGNDDYVSPEEVAQYENDTEVQPNPLPEKPNGYFAELLDNAKDMLQANLLNYDSIQKGRRQGEILQALQNRDYKDEDEYNSLQREYAQLQNDKADVDSQFQRNQDTLDSRNSFMSNLTQMGGTMHGTRQSLTGGIIGGVAGGLLGATSLTPFGVAAGASAGFNLGRYAGGVYGADYEARCNADDARVKVLQGGGTPDEAEAAWQEAYKSNLATTLPEAIALQYVGGKALGAVGNKIPIVKTANKEFADSAFGKAISSVSGFDPINKIADSVANKTGSAIAGRVAGTGAAMIGSAIGEGIQEPTQDYFTEIAVNNQRPNFDPNNYDQNLTTLGGAKDFYSRPEEIQTAKQAAIQNHIDNNKGSLLTC
jgi:hypothetical protein